MSTIAERFGHSSFTETPSAHPQILGTNKVGVEVELEDLPSTSFSSEFWRVTHDGSLRNNGVEFVMDGCFGGADLFHAAVALDTYLTSRHPDGNWRCSTHVHMDVRSFNTHQLKNLILINTVYEKLLFRISGFHRYTNNFCASMGYMQNQMELLAGIWHAEDSIFFDVLMSSWDKYSAFNLLPIQRFGSVEFRSSAAEWRKGKLVRLCNRFLALHKLAEEWEGTHDDLLVHLTTLHPKDIFRKGLSRGTLPETWEEDVSIGMKLANDILHLGRVEQVGMMVPPAPRRGRGAPQEFFVDDLRIQISALVDDEPTFWMPQSRYGALINILRNEYDVVDNAGEEGSRRIVSASFIRSARNSSHQFALSTLIDNVDGMHNVYNEWIDSFHMWEDDFGEIEDDDEE